MKEAMAAYKNGIAMPIRKKKEINLLTVLAPPLILKSLGVNDHGTPIRLYC